MERKKLIGLLCVTVVFVLACVPALPIVAPLPTQPAGAVETIIAATYGAAQAGTALAINRYTPTPSPLPTLTPSLTPTVTLTPTSIIVFSIPAGGGSGGGTGGGTGGGSGGGGGGGGGGGNPDDYACVVLSTSPPLGASVPRGKNFNVVWKVLNTGYKTWDHNSVDYRYQSGARIHVQPIYDLPRDVRSQQQIDLVADMTAPTNAGTYSATWVIRVGSRNFCSMQFRVVVP